MSGKNYDVFLSHNSADKPAVEILAQKLHAQGVRIFLDKWNLIPGKPWQEELEKALTLSETCAVFQGPHGPGTWENEEMRAALAYRAHDGILRVFAVFLPGSMPDRADLPPFLKRFTWVDFSSGLEDSDAFRRLLCGIRGEEPGPPRSQANTKGEAVRMGRPPYLGMLPFNINDAKLFFGRTGLVAYLIERLRNRHFLAVVGPSGSGKSSLVRAGLIHELREGALPESRTWRILTFRPWQNPLRNLATQLLKDLEDPDISLIDRIDRLVREMSESPYALATEVRRTAQPQTLLVIDQFEEIFTSSDTERQAFFANLLDATGLASAKISAVIVLRADFYARIAAYPDLAERIAARQVIVTPMHEGELSQAIRRPAELSGLRFEKDLDYEILREMDGQTGALPLLQNALLQLWERREDNTLTYAAYKAIGYVKGSIANWANSVYERLSTIQQTLARRILIELVQPEGNARRRVLKEELVAGTHQTPETIEVLEHLIKERILTTDLDAANQDNLVEIAHEALLREWASLREWIEESRASRLTRAQFQERVRAWERLGRDLGSLVRGAELKLFDLWSRENPDEVDSRGKEYLEACREIERVERELRREVTKNLREAKSLDSRERRGATVQNIQSMAPPRQAIEITKSPEFRHPDLEITIRVEKPFSLSFEINAPAEGMHAFSLRSKLLPAAPEEYFRDLLGSLENLPSDTEEATGQSAEVILDSKGLDIWEMFPHELQRLLWKHRRKGHTLLIQSNDPYIPWEIARLQGWNKQGKKILGPFLCEAFAVTRWVPGVPIKTRLLLQSLALVTPNPRQPKEAAVEQKEIRSLAERHGVVVTDIEPTYLAVRRAMTSGAYDVWHFAGYSAAIRDDANRWDIELDGLARFATEDLLAETSNRGLERVLVFLSGCSTRRSGFMLTPPEGWAQGFLNAGAVAFIGTYWGITSDKSREMAVAIYKNLFDGKPIGEALRLARLHLHKRHKGDPTWLAYTVFAHPLTTCGPLPAKVIQREHVRDREPEQLTISTRSWRKDIDPPGALLRAQYRVVPFHQRETELSDLLAWCRDPLALRVRLYTGHGGTGKSRMVQEAALQMREEGWWTGFVISEALQYPEKTWEALARSEGRVLIIVDYAETNRSFLVSILRSMYRSKSQPIRLILLARNAFGWWEQLKAESDGVAEILNSRATSTHSLSPLADSLDARRASYTIAAKAFSQILQVAQPSEPPPDLDAEYFANGLILHMRALIDVMEGREAVKNEDGVLDRILARERKFWEEHVRDRGLPLEIASGIGRAMAVITLGGGIAEEVQSIELLRKIKFFESKSEEVLMEIARLLHEIYPGKRWIEPIEPDLLGEHLAQRELEKGADELFDLLQRPRYGG